MDSPWEVFGRAGSDLLVLVDLLQDFLCERGLMSGATTPSVTAALTLSSAQLDFCISGWFSASIRGMETWGDEVRGDFGGGSGLGVLSNSLLVP